MPYIPEAEREDVYQCVTNYPEADNPGQLTYLLFTTVRRYISRRGNRFQVFAEVLGCLQAVSLELYRRQVAPYEDTKIEENGDVLS